MDLKPYLREADDAAPDAGFEEVNLDSIASFRSGEGISIARLSEQTSEEPVPVYGGNGIAGYTARPTVTQSTIVIGRVGQRCGEVYLTKGPAWITDNALYPRTIFRDIDIQFLGRALQAANLNASKNRNDLPLITQTILKSIRIHVPTRRSEQEAICAVLSDADALIESLEQLLAKKRQIKQGAMQEYLSGQRRLPGFTGNWRDESLGDLGRWRGGMTPSMVRTDYWEPGDVPWISSGDVKSKKLTHTGSSISQRAIQEGATTLIPANALVIVVRSGILRKYLPVAMTMAPMAINQDIKALIPKPTVAAEFLLQSLMVNGNEILASCLKSGTTVESIEFKWLKDFQILLPPHDEQVAIATALSDQDAEIEILERNMVKAHQVKQGMMQQLLTGRIRLVDASTAADLQLVQSA